MSVSLKGVATAFVTAAKKFKAEILTVASDAPKVIGKIEADAPEIENLTELVFPGAVAIEQAGLVALEALGDAIVAAGPAASANGLSVTLDQDAWAKVQAALPTLKTLAAKA